jgi:hypothetical protein
MRHAFSLALMTASPCTQEPAWPTALHAATMQPAAPPPPQQRHKTPSPRSPMPAASPSGACMSPLTAMTPPECKAMLEAVEDAMQLLHDRPGSPGMPSWSSEAPYILPAAFSYSHPTPLPSSCPQHLRALRKTSLMSGWLSLACRRFPRACTPSCR